MIIFFNKNTGKIAGTINGRVNSKEELNMWIGDKKETDRIICQWKAVRFFDKKGSQVDPIKSKDKVVDVEFEPDNDQKDLFNEIDQRKSNILEYKVDIKTKKIIKSER